MWVLWVGVGCERGIFKKLIVIGIDKIFFIYYLVVRVIVGIVIINIKVDEIGLLEFC